MKSRVSWMLGLAACLVGLVAQPATAADDSPEAAAVQAAAETFVKAFNAGKADALAAQFLPQGELIDEEGQIYQGRKELEKLFAAYFAKFPVSSLGMHIETILKLVQSLAIDEGTR